MSGLPETRYTVTPDGTNIAYRLMGTGPDEIVFIPPWMSSVELDVEDPYIGPTVRRLASLGRLVSFDKRGGGMSDRIPPDVLASIETRAADLGSVLDAAGCERPTVFAGADGAAVALVYAASHPDRLRGLCLYAPFARALEAPDYPLGYPTEVVDLMVAATVETWGSGRVAPTAPSLADDPGFLSWFGSYQRRSASPAAGGQFLRMAIETDVRAVLSSVRVPTVVIHRTGDQLVPVAAGRYVADHIAGARLVEVPGDDHLWAVGDTGAVLDVVEEMVTGRQASRPVTRVLVTVLFTDIVGSTALASDLGDQQWLDLLASHDTAVRRQLERFGGTEVKATGDGFCATFASPGQAIRGATAIRDAVAPLGLEVRAGLHTGEIELRGADVGGVAVHIAARVSALAQAGEVLVSGAVPPLVMGSGIEFENRGEHALKGVPGQWRIHAVLA